MPVKTRPFDLRGESGNGSDAARQVSRFRCRAAKRLSTSAESALMMMRGRNPISSRYTLSLRERIDLDANS